MKKYLTLSIVLLLIGLNNRLVSQNNKEKAEAPQRLVLLEEFTSSTCNPCARLNVFLNEWLEENADKCVSIKYQMNFPSPGDPYFTADGSTRKIACKVTSVPAPFVEGVNISGTETNTYKEWQEEVSKAIEAAYEVPAEAAITGAFQIVGDIIYVKIEVTPYVSGEDYLVYVSVNEKKTTKNTRPTGQGGNGEKEFFHVMMKMLPDAKGTSVTFTENQPVWLNFVQDLSTTNIEEMDDLEVAVFVQHKTSKAVLNAAYLTPTSSLPLPPANMSATQQGQTLDIDIAWEQPATEEDITIDGYNIYRDGMKLNTTPVTDLFFTDHAPSYGIIYQYMVAAVSGEMEGFFATDTELTYIDAESIRDNDLKTNIRVYPNPVKDQLKIKNEEKAIINIQLFDTTGRMLQEINNINNNETTIDLSGFANGVYFLKTDGQVIKIMKH